VPALGHVGRKGAAAHSGGSVEIVDGAAEGTAAPIAPQSLVGRESAAPDGEGGAIRIGDGPALRRGPVVGVAAPLVVGKAVVRERQSAADVQDAPAGADGGAAARQTVFNADFRGAPGFAK